MTLLWVMISNAAAQEWLARTAELEGEEDFQGALDFLRSQDSAVPAGERYLYLERKYQLEIHLNLRDAAQQTAAAWRSLAIEREDQAEAVRAAIRLAQVIREKGQLQEAARWNDEAVELGSSLQEPLLLAEALINQSEVRANMGDYEGGQASLEDARRLPEVLSDPELAYRFWNASGTLLSYQGYPEAAAEEYEKSLTLARAHFPRRIPVALTNLAQTQLSLQRYAPALAGFQEVFELETTPSVVVITSIGICQYELNRFEEALETFESARLLAEELGSRRLRAWALGEKGMAVTKARGNFSEGERLLRESASEFRILGDLRNALIMDENLATSWRDSKRWSDALEHYRKVEAEYSRIPGQKINANIYKSIAQCLLELKRYPEAERMFARAHRLALESGDSKRIWQGAHLLARLYVETGRPDEAEAQFLLALETIEAARQDLRLESFKTDFFEDKVQVYEDYIGFLQERGGTDVDALTLAVAERAKARSLLDILAESQSRLHQTLPPDVLAEEQRLLNEISRLQTALRNGVAEAGDDQRLREVEAALQGVHLRVQRDSPDFDEFRYPKPASLEELQQVLQPGEQILEFFLGLRASYRWQVSRDHVRLQTLPASAEIEKHVRAALTSFLDPGSDLRDLREVGRILLSGLAPQPNQSLILIPSGILHYFPFEALAVEDDFSWLWQADTSYLPSASTLRFLRNRVRAPLQTPRLLALGNPLFPVSSDVDRSALGGLGTLGRLPYTREEVKRVESIFGAAHSTLLLDGEAQESGFKAQHLDQYSVIHLATHGWIDPQFPSRSGIVFGVDSGAEDGILQVREIFGLRLNAELVTLSACQTGLGRLVTGEGMVGLTRAFFFAGADSALATLWNINDRVSALFMDHFYSALREGVSRASAARRARNALFRDGKHSHPSFWAPFVIRGLGSGNVRIPASSEPGIPLWTMSLSLLGLLVLSAYGRAIVLLFRERKK